MDLGTFSFLLLATGASTVENKPYVNTSAKSSAAVSPDV
jgi:hypothetical protein